MLPRWCFRWANLPCAVYWSALAAVLLCAARPLLADLKETPVNTNDWQHTVHDRRQVAEEQAARKLEEADKLYESTHPVEQREAAWEGAGVFLLVVLAGCGLAFWRSKGKAGPAVVALPGAFGAGSAANIVSQNTEHRHRSRGWRRSFWSLLKPSHRRHRHHPHRHSHRHHHHHRHSRSSREG